MTKQERDKLRELALAATPGEWGLVKGSFLYQTDIKAGADTLLTVYGENGENAANAAYIAAANPATLLALLDRIDELEGDAERYRWIRANCLSVTDLAATRIGASDEAIDKARGQ